MLKTDKKKKGKKPKLKRETEKGTRQLSVNECKFELDGVLKLVLSTITQKAIGCVVGENITTDDPWIFVKKEKIEDNLELHEDSSEFLPIKGSILKYPEDEILIGFDKPVAEDLQEFFICSNLKAKRHVIEIIEIQKAEIQERLKQSVCKEAREWSSLGSETEVDENMIQNFRPLLEIEFDSKYPLYTEKKKFKLRLVEDAIDGYVEILPGRFPITNIYRTRVDTGTQVTPSTINKEAQTNLKYPKHASTQYNYEYKEPKLSASSVKHLNKFINLQLENLSDTLHVNEHINLHTNDYTQMAKKVWRSAVIVTRDIASFRDVLTSKGKLVSDVSLDPMVSGIQAASYTRNPFNKIFSSPNSEDEVNEITFDKHIVLVWSNTDTLVPKLFLQAYREVNKLRFCPFKPNILVGGCTNGQIVVWDLSGRLEKVETLEVLTPREQKHRLIINSLMTWMKNYHSINVVSPTAVSSLDFCHKSAVTHISWLLPDTQVTRNGKLEHNGEPSMQFMTCGLDGRVLIWDLMQKPRDAVAPRVKKSQRLGELPSALTMRKSEFRDLNNVLIPQYKLNVKNVETAIPYPLCALSIRNKNFGFKALNPQTLFNPFQRTFFEYVPTHAPYKFLPEIIAGDKLGHLFHCTFEGHDFDQGQRVNYENVKYKQFTIIHDGPIRSCLPNSVDENLILTVGGRVFAVWDITRNDRPIFWRKSKQRYVAGIWSGQVPTDIVMSRADSYFETWEVLSRPKTPGRLVRLTGTSIMDQFSDNTKNHVKKFTFIATDVVGAVKVYQIPRITRLLPKELITKVATLRDHTYEQRIKARAWLDAWKKRHWNAPGAAAEEQDQEQNIEAPNREEKSQDKPEPKIEEETPENAKEAKASIQPSSQAEEDDPSKKRAEFLDKLASGDTWFEKQEKLMYNILLEKKKLNLAEIERNKIPLQNLIEERKQKAIKIKEALAKNEEVFDTATRKIFKEKKIKQRMKFKVSFPDEITEIMKENIIGQYQDSVHGVMKYIKRNQFIHDFNWGKMVQQAKERKPNGFSKTHIDQKLRYSGRDGNERKTTIAYNHPEDSITAIVVPTSTISNINV